MYANDVCQQQSRQFGREATIVTCPQTALARKPFCHRFLVVSDNLLPIRVVWRPTADADCRHQLLIEHGTRVNRYDLPATGGVDVRQQFIARAGDQLSFEYVVLLQAKHDSHFGLSTVTADLIDLAAQTHISLMNRSVTSDGEPGDKRVASRSRESLSILIGAAGPYELRLGTSVDPESPADRHLLIDSVRICDFSGTTITQLASVSCAGCVRRAASQKRNRSNTTIAP